MRYVTLTLYVCEDPKALTADEAAEYLQLCMSGDQPAVVGSWNDAYRVLRTLGLDAEEARHRINFARTGDMYATCTATRRRQQRSALHGS
jgi:hypothetical protein